MQTIEQIKHDEDMIKTRAEFAKAWQSELRPWLLAMRIETIQVNLWQDLAWKAFTAGRKTK